jgi:hypothetical protein
MRLSGEFVKIELHASSCGGTSGRTSSRAGFDSVPVTVSIGR